MGLYKDVEEALMLHTGRPESGRHALPALTHVLMRKDKCAPSTRKSECDSNRLIKRETGTWLFKT